MGRMLFWACSAYKLVCYFTNWSQYRPEPAKFFPKDVDPCLCTHLIYAFATMNDNKIAPYEWNDIDVLYPGFQALKEQSEMIQAFEEEAEEAGKPRLLITAAVSAGKETTDAGYEIAEIGKLLDFISMMTYDFHGGWDPCTGHNSPLHVGSKDQGNMRYFNCEYAMKYWRDNGVPSEKLIMGFPTYGRTFRLSTSDTCLCPSLWSRVDFLKENNFGGAMVWAIDLDDFLGSFCNEGKYPLILELQSLLGLSSECTPSATKTWYHQQVIPRSEGFCANIGGDSGSGGEGGGDGGSEGDEGFCTGKADGIYSDPEDNTKFYQSAGGRTFYFQCNQGLVFDQTCICCNWPSI
ncbi:acidic mammalian chitinase-like [Bos indicus x Bos taurus]|uniref:acidic mammalian chitinase-like n=1 Tax=Bos indicus x Bos taurus TaxID=30522 RepID=UPI000F7D5630|nr:acidic mammalian chitinase-like [Bos indicus x Bos taurus]